METIALTPTTSNRSYDSFSNSFRDFFRVNSVGGCLTVCPQYVPVCSKHERKRGFIFVGGESDSLRVFPCNCRRLQFPVGVNRAANNYAHLPGSISFAAGLLTAAPGLCRPPQIPSPQRRNGRRHRVAPGWDRISERSNSSAFELWSSVLLEALPTHWYSKLIFFETLIGFGWRRSRD